MKECIKRKINLIKSENLFSKNYETIEIQEHQIVDSEIEFIKTKLSDQSVYYSINRNERIIYCKHCGEIIYKK